MGCECSSNKNNSKQGLSTKIYFSKVPDKIEIDSKEIKEQWHNEESKIIEFFRSIYQTYNLSFFDLIKVTKFKLSKDFFNKFEVIKERKFSLVKKNATSINEDLLREIKENIDQFFQKFPELQRYNDFKLLDINLILLGEKSEAMLKIQKIFSPQQNISLQSLKEEYISVYNTTKINIFIFYSKIENLSIYESDKIKEIHSLSQTNKNLIDFYLVYVHDIANDQLLRSVLENLEEKGLDKIQNTYLMDPEECRRYIRRETLESDGCYIFDKGVLKFAGDLMNLFIDDVKFYMENNKTQYQKSDYTTRKLYICDYFLKTFDNSNLNLFPFSFNIDLIKYVNIEYSIKKEVENEVVSFEKKFLYFGPIQAKIDYYSKIFKSSEFKIEGWKSKNSQVNLNEILEYLTKNLSVLSNDFCSLVKKSSFNDVEIISFILKKLNISKKEKLVIEIENDDKFEKYFNYNYNPKKKVRIYYNVNEDNKDSLNNNSDNLFKSLSSYSKYNITDMIFLPEIDSELTNEKSLEFFYKGKFEDKSINVNFEYDKAKIILILNDIQGNSEKELDIILTLLNSIKESNEIKKTQDFSFFPVFVGYGNIDYDFSKFKQLNFENILHLSNNNRQNLINFKFWFHSKSYNFKYSFILLDTNKKVRYVGNLSEIDINLTLTEFNTKSGKIVVKENKIINDNNKIKDIKTKLITIFKELNVKYNPYINFNYKKLYEYQEDKLIKNYYKEIKLNLIIKDKTKTSGNNILINLLDLIKNSVDLNIINVPSTSIEIENINNIIYCNCGKEVGRTSKGNSSTCKESFFYYNPIEKQILCQYCEETYNNKKENRIKLPELIYIKFEEYDENQFNEIIDDFFTINKVESIANLKCFICENNFLEQENIYLLLNDFHYEWEYTWDAQPSTLKYSPIYICNDNCFNTISGKVLTNFNQKQACNIKQLNLKQKTLILKKFTISRNFNDGIGSSLSSISGASGASEDINNENISNKS